MSILTIYLFLDTLRSGTGVYLDDSHLDAFDKYRVLFKGPLTVPPGDMKSNITIRGEVQ